MALRFSLKWLLVLIGLAGASMALVTQFGIEEADFEVWENNLHLNYDGMVQGELRLGYEGTEYDDSPWPFECRINNIVDRDLLKLKAGTKSKIKYRARQFGPLKTQEPCQIYLTRVLGIDPQAIVGYVMIRGRTEVVIDGSR